MRRLIIFLWATALATALAASSAGATSSSALGSLLVRSGEMPGFVLDGKPTLGATPTAFVTNVYKATGSTASSAVATLDSEGFVGGANEYLYSSFGIADSQVWVFKTAKDAAKFLRTTFSKAKSNLPKGSTLRTLKINVTGARGFDAVSGKKVEGDAYMALGRCMLFVGDEVEGTAAKANTPVLAGSLAVHNRAQSVCD